VENKRKWKRPRGPIWPGIHFGPWPTPGNYRSGTLSSPSLSLTRGSHSSAQVIFFPSPVITPETPWSSPLQFPSNPCPFRHPTMPIRSTTPPLHFPSAPSLNSAAGPSKFLAEAPLCLRPTELVSDVSRWFRRPILVFFSSPCSGAPGDALCSLFGAADWRRRTDPKHTDIVLTLAALSSFAWKQSKSSTTLSSSPRGSDPRGGLAVVQGSSERHRRPPPVCRSPVITGTLASTGELPLHLISAIRS
jgi:hypothetical protein